MAHNARLTAFTRLHLVEPAAGVRTGLDLCSARRLPGDCLQVVAAI